MSSKKIVLGVLVVLLISVLYINFIAVPFSNPGELYFSVKASRESATLETLDANEKHLYILELLKDRIYFYNHSAATDNCIELILAEDEISRLLQVSSANRFMYKHNFTNELDVLFTTLESTSCPHKQAFNRIPFVLNTEFINGSIYKISNYQHDIQATCLLIDRIECLPDILRSKFFYVEKITNDSQKHSDIVVIVNQYLTLFHAN